MNVYASRQPIPPRKTMLKFCEKNEHTTPNYYRIPLLYAQLVFYAAGIAVVAKNELSGVCIVLRSGGIWHGGLRDRSRVPLRTFPQHTYDRKGLDFVMFHSPSAR